MSVVDRFVSVASRFRSVSAAFQLGLTVAGTLMIFWGLFGLAVVFPSMSQSESGFAEGLALILFGLAFVGGFVVLSAGLLIPQQATAGIQFTRRQRKLLAYGAVVPVVGVIATPAVLQLAPSLVEPAQPILVVALVVVVLSGPFATLLALVSKLRSR